jgi:23S rRNA pseudouridine2605 synthase
MANKKVNQKIQGIPLNKFLADAGIASRRKTVDLIKKGSVTVDGEIITEPGYRVEPKAVVCVDGNKIVAQKFIYILLNKPKGYITTVSDERGRATVFDLIDLDGVRLFSVGRLDRSTTGLLLLTNDGALAQKLSHPKYNVSKEYCVTTKNVVTPEHCRQIAKGVMLDDGIVDVDEVVRENKNSFCLTLHSGKNRVVRRLCDELGLIIQKLDRVAYAGLTKQGLRLGQWRHLTKEEVAMLKKG